MGMSVSISHSPTTKTKGWGKEIWITNNESYCGKLLCFNEGACFSMHYHMIKKETWYVQKGKVECTLIRTEDASRYTFMLEEGEALTILPGQPHQVRALEDSVIFEVSTKHFDRDSYRVEPGDSQKT